MQITVAVKAPGKIRTPFLAMLTDPGDPCPAVCAEANARIVKRYLREVKQDKIDGPYLWGPGPGEPIEHYCVFAPSLLKDYEAGERIKIAAARLFQQASGLRKKKITFWLEGEEAAQRVGQIAEAVRLWNYTFDKYKPSVKKSKAQKIETVELLAPRSSLAAAQRAVARAETVCAGVNLARDLINEPGMTIYPETLARAAQKTARAGNLGIDILREGRLKRQGYNGLLIVGQGSANPPRLIVMRYQPKGKAGKEHIVLVGKGLTFDTGGISLKPSDKMWQMKGDMSGGAAVIGAMQVIAALKPKVQVTGIVAAAHNAVGPTAVHPGDIFIAKNGKSVMVDNTDAEGRLILTDALHRAGEEGATHIVDFATLTGSCQRALGDALSGIFANDLAWRERVSAAGAAAGEEYWPLPLYQEYKKLLKCDIADLNNLASSPNAGATTAALFLQEFVPDNVSWAHCDIAGTFIHDRDWRYLKAGPAGVGVRTMVNLVAP